MLYNSKDTYVNLRQSPNGNIITAIEQSSALSSCKTNEQDLQSGGFILFLGRDTSNAKWYKVAYIPKNASQKHAIYGVIYQSQVKPFYECK